MSKQPFCAEQFTSTEFSSAQEKATWANAMASWVKRGFPKNGWRKGLYKPLHTHMYGHIAEYDQHGFYAVWFADIHQQLKWLKYAAEGGVFSWSHGDPKFTWSDVERALSAWIRESGLIDHYQQLCAQEIETKERALFVHLQRKYAPEQGKQPQAEVPPGNTTPAISTSRDQKDPVPRARSSTRQKNNCPSRYVSFSLFEQE